MELPSIIASIFITGIAVFLVVNPFFQMKPTEINGEVSEAIDLKHIYVILNEIEMDYNMGKIALEDYLKLRNQYEVLIASKINQQQQENELLEQEFQQLVDRKRQLTQEISRLKSLGKQSNATTKQKLITLEKELATVNQSLQRFIS